MRDSSWRRRSRLASCQRRPTWCCPWGPGALRRASRSAWAWQGCARRSSRRESHRESSPTPIGWSRSSARPMRLLQRHGRGDCAFAEAVPVVVDHSAPCRGVRAAVRGRRVDAADRVSRAASASKASPLLLDATYAAKAAAVALSLSTSLSGSPATSAASGSGRGVLLWVTFDGRPFGGLRTGSSTDSHTGGTTDTGGQPDE